MFPADFEQIPLEGASRAAGGGDALIAIRWDDDGEEGEEERLCSQDVEQLVERYVVTRRRCEELESENAKLTQQLLECASGQAPDTLVIQVSPEMW